MAGRGCSPRRGLSRMRMDVRVRVGVPGRTRAAGRGRSQRFGRVRTLVSQDWPVVAGQFRILFFDLLPLLQRMLPVQDRLSVATVRLLP